MSSQILIAYLSTFSSFLPLLIFRKADINDCNKFILILIITSLLSDVVMLLLLKQGVRNLLIAHIYGLLEIILLTLFFISSLRIRSNLMIALSLLCALLYVIDSIFLTGIGQFNGGARMVESFLFLTYSIIFYGMIYKNQEHTFIEKTQEFWFVSGIFIFFGGAFFSFVLGKLILTTSTPWILHNVSNILKNLLFTVGFFVNRKRKDAR